MKIEFAQELSPKQESKLIDWQAKLPQKYTGAVGGRYTYSFTPTSLGVITKVSDAITNEVLDLTEYEGW